MECPYCGSSDLYKKGKTRLGKQTYLCKTCNHRFTENPDISKINTDRLPQRFINKQIIATLIRKGDSETIKQFGITKNKLSEIKESERFDKKAYPKILVLDVETLPLHARLFGLFKQRIPHTNIIEGKDICCCSWAAKWLYEPVVMGDVVTPEEAVAHNDKRIMESLWPLLEEAGIVIGHNGKNFDIRLINSRFIDHRIKPTTPYQVIDTLKESQKIFRTTSHRLDYLGKFLFNKGKLETDFGLWVKCDEGDQESLDYMMKYNKEDVLLLEEVYNEMKPYFTGHPNLALHSHSTDRECPYCESTNLLPTDQYYVTPAGRYSVLRCGDCGGISRLRTSDLTKEERNSLIVSIAH